MSEETRSERAVGFLDLAGYTSLTDVHGDDAAVEVVDRFCAVVRGCLGDGDVLVKSIGDAVLVHSSDAPALTSLSARICATLDSEAAFPILRVGLHNGPVVLRDDDVLGATVNVAARITAQAKGGQVLASSGFASSLAPDAWQVRPLGPFRLKGLTEPVDLVELELCPHPQDRPVDPVCGMALSATVAARLELDGRQWSFCSQQCLRRWTAALD